jgi:hypothetical protein
VIRSGEELAARVYHDIFLRRGPFESIRQEKMPCASRVRLAAPYVGESVASKLPVRRYLYQRACLLGRGETLKRSLLSRYEALFPREMWPDDFSHLAPYPAFRRLAADYRAVVRDTRRAMREAERRILASWQYERTPGGDGAIFSAAIRDGALVLAASLGPFDPFPRHLGTSFRFGDRPPVYLHFDEDLFFVDIEAYLPLFHIPLDEFRRRYELLLALVEVIRERLAP